MRREARPARLPQIGTVLVQKMPEPAGAKRYSVPLVVGRSCAASGMYFETNKFALANLLCQSTVIRIGNLTMNSYPTGVPAKKILVVDDNEIVVRTISMKLQGAGYEVIAAMDGSEAVALARKESPDLILLDIGFPLDVGSVPWDGFRIMEWFHRLDAARRIPIIVITGSEDPKTKERATAAGAVAYFQKPIEHDYLLKVVRATLGDTAAPAA